MIPTLSPAPHQPSSHHTSYRCGCLGLASSLCLESQKHTSSSHSYAIPFLGTGRPWHSRGSLGIVPIHQPGRRQDSRQHTRDFASSSSCSIQKLSRLTLLPSRSTPKQIPQGSEARTKQVPVGSALKVSFTTAKGGKNLNTHHQMNGTKCGPSLQWSIIQPPKENMLPHVTTWEGHGGHEANTEQRP